MGIKSNYNKFLRDISPNIFNTVHISNYIHKKIAIDTTLYMYKYKAIFGDTWLEGFARLIKCLRDNGVHCIFILDGPSPVEKTEEQTKRRESKQKLIEQIKAINEDITIYRRNGSVGDHLTKLFKDTGGIVIDSEIDMRYEKKSRQVVNINNNDFIELKKLFDLYGVSWHEAPGEAEKYGCKLCIDNMVDAVLSDDTDILAYGSPVCLSKLDVISGLVCQVNYQQLLTELGFDRMQHLDHCIMCGTDYNDNIKGIGSHKSYKLMQKYNNIEQIVSNIVEESDLGERANDLRKMFTYFIDISDVKILYNNIPDSEGIMAFLKDKKIAYVDLQFIPNKVTIKFI